MMEAQAAMKALADEEATPTHPPKSARLEAIAVGWTRAGEKANASVIAKKYPDTTSQPEMAGNTDRLLWRLGLLPFMSHKC